MSDSSLESVAKEIRRLSVSMTSKAGSGHLTSSLSCADILATLFGEILVYDHSLSSNIYNDRFILSKGHATPALYATYALCGWIPVHELDTYRQKNSRLEGHPTRRLPYIDVATGSLGQGVAVGIGIALGMKDIEPRPHVYVLVGDGELAEGSVWEALAVATNLGIDNMTVIVDLNGLGQSGPSLFGTDAEMLAKRAESFGWSTDIVDGHNIEALTTSLKTTITTPGRHMVIAKTIKGKGISLLEGKEGWHAKVLKGDELAVAQQELGNHEPVTLTVKSPSRSVAIKPMRFHPKLLVPHFDELTATKTAFGKALEYAVASAVDVRVLDADVKNSTMTELAFKQQPDRCIEVSIAEQTMVGIACGLDVMGKRVVLSTFAAFLTRAFDQLRIASLSERSFVVNGSYAGVSIGHDGSSQMGLEDIAIMRTLPNSVVLYPADAVSAFALTVEAIAREELVYIRTTREPTPLIYSPMTTFPVGGSHIHGQSDSDRVTVIAAGITLFEALRAQTTLREQGILVRVIDLYSVKPLDHTTLRSSVMQTNGKLVIVEDHRSEGGIGEAVLSALNEDGLALHYKHLSVTGIPHSATPKEELALHEIDADAIIRAVHKLL